MDALILLWGWRAGALGAIALALGAFAWRRSRGSKQAAARVADVRLAHPQLSLDLGPAKLAMLREWAKTQGMPFESWAERTLMDAVPVSLRQRWLQNGGIDALDRVFLALDADDAAALPPNVFGFAPKYKPLPVVQEPEEKVQKIEVQGHPCFHLSGEFPSHFKPGECSGVCMHRSQQGRVCFWPSQTARNCQVFEPKVVPQRKRIA